MRRCNECKDGIFSKTCKNQIKENEEFEANLSLPKKKLLLILVIRFLIRMDKMIYL